jgi:hypothetical protein
LRWKDENKGKEKRDFICSFGERLLGRCVANPSAPHGLALRRACLPSEDAEEHS